MRVKFHAKGGKMSDEVINNEFLDNLKQASVSEQIDLERANAEQIATLEKIAKDEKFSVSEFKKFLAGILYANKYVKFDNPPTLRFVGDDVLSEAFAQSRYDKNTIDISEGWAMQVADASEDSYEILLYLIMSLAHEKRHINQYEFVKELYSGEHSPEEIDENSKKVAYDFSANISNGLMEGDQILDYYNFILPYLSQTAKAHIKEYEDTLKRDIKAELQNARLESYSNAAHEYDARMSGNKFSEQLFEKWGNDPLASENLRTFCKRIIKDFIHEIISEEQTENDDRAFYEWFEQVVEDDVKNISISELIKHEEKIVHAYKTEKDNKKSEAMIDSLWAVNGHILEKKLHSAPEEEVFSSLSTAIDANAYVTYKNILTLIKARGTVDSQFKVHAQEMVMSILSSELSSNLRGKSFEQIVHILSPEQVLNVATSMLENKNLMLPYLLMKEFAGKNNFEEEASNKRLLPLAVNLTKYVKEIFSRRYSKLLIFEPKDIEAWKGELAYISNLLIAYINFFELHDQDVSDLDSLLENVNNLYNSHQNKNENASGKKEESQPE